MQKRPWLLYPLLFLVAFQAVGALYGGLALVTAPDGSILQMPLSWLENSPFPDFLIPGIVLGLVLGLFPLLLLPALWFKPNWKWPNVLNLYKQRHWAITYALYLGVMMVAWINFQLLFVQRYFWLQPVIALIGLLIIIFSLLPKVLLYYQAKPEQP
ncbi:MAG: hypothetical protein U0T75_09445 [Chitinophagales bacterium]